MHGPTTRLSVVAALGSLLLAAPALAFVEPQPGALSAQVVAPAGFVATVAPQDLTEVRGEVDPALLADVAAFQAQAGGEWRFYVDRRSGGMALVEGTGLPWVAPGATVGATRTALETSARAFIEQYPNLFGLRSSDLALDTAGTVNFGEGKQYWSVVFRQIAGGLAVDASRVVFRISHGNLVQFGVDHTVPALRIRTAPSPAISAVQARAALAAHVGGLAPTDHFLEDGTLIWAARGAADEVGYTGPIGYGWEPVLAYRFVFQRAGLLGTWQALVDARTGEVARFVDANDYAAVVKGSVYTFSNCTDPLNCVPGSQNELSITIPYAALNFVGGTCSGDGCYSNSAGSFDYPPGATSSATSLNGKYFQVNDTCGAVTATGVAPGDIDLGTSPPNPPANTNTDCQPATQQSPPGTGPDSGGAGDTHSARNTFYHLNIMNQKARAYLPGNDWLKGADGASGPVLINTDLPPACNAFWQGGTGSLNFMRVTPGLFCNNTGEIPDVFLHEYGHGIDQNDGTGTAPESATGEAMGDSFALLQGQHSCIGPGFQLPIPTNANWGNRAGYGTGSALCSGVRDLDYTRFCYHGSGAGCSASLDPDAPNGSRAGLTPPPNPPDAGTPSRWNHMIQTAPAGVADGQSNFYSCGGPETTGCAGPLNHGCHCESTIASQSNWDLARQLIATEFGGNAYAVPQGPKEVSGWQYMDRLWYLTRDLAVSGYSVTGPAPAGTTNGCGIDNWFSTYRFVDDDDGNLADGTPHAGILFSAFSLHATACGTAGDPSNQATGCSAPSAAPALSSCDNKAPVQLSWTASPGAHQYRVLRNTLGCGFGFTPLASLNGSQQYFEDPDVAPGVTYYYSVQPVAANASCYGHTSNCIAVTPSTCAASSVTPPTGLALSTPADNKVQVSWNAVAGAGAYKVYRKQGVCSSGAPFVAIGTTQAPSTVFLDNIGLQGSLDYSYQVVASDTSCAACTSAPSACQTIQATGSCAIPPSFAGVSTVTAGAAGQCQLTVSWQAGAPVCGSTLAYDVHRSRDPRFVPGPSNLLVSSLTGTSFTDYSAEGGTRYYYNVQAIDSRGNLDGNTLRVGETAVGSLSPGAFSDDAGDTVRAHFSPSPTTNNQWSIRLSGTSNATKQYATTPSGDYQANMCEGLESETIFLGANPTLSFRSRYSTEQGWDGGYIEVSTQAGGFSDWTKLTSVNYPGVMSGPLGSPACGGPGFDDGEPVFTGSGDWATYSGSLSAYANQRVRIRFLFSSDPSTQMEGWFIDDVSVDDTQIPGSCVSEVSGPMSPVPLDVVLRPNGNLDFIFEDLGTAASSYNVYEGTLGTFYSNVATSCHNTATTSGPGPGQRTWSDYATSSTNAYFLMSASTSSAEGTAGEDSQGRQISTPPPLCGPMP